jgi:hypothetical protein
MWLFLLTTYWLLIIALFAVLLRRLAAVRKEFLTPSQRKGFAATQ